MTGLGAQPKKESSRKRKLNCRYEPGHIAQHREYSQYFVRTKHGVQPLKAESLCCIPETYNDMVHQLYFNFFKWWKNKCNEGGTRRMNITNTWSDVTHRISILIKSELGRPPEEVNGPLQYSCLENLWTEEACVPQSTESQNRHDWVTNILTFTLKS